MQRSLGWAVIALVSIWVAVAIISVTATDLTFGADETKIPIVQIVTWIWGVVASAYVLNSFVQQRGPGDERVRAWAGISVATFVIWAIVTVVAVLIPEFTFDLLDDPIVIPLGALIAPAAGVAVTAIAAQYVPRLSVNAFTEDSMY